MPTDSERRLLATYPLPYSELLSKLRAGPLTWYRWGDGEWRALAGDVGSNCDAHPRQPAGRDLAKVMTARPPGLHGMQPLARRIMTPKIVGVLTRLWKGWAPKKPYWIGGELCAGLYWVTLRPEFQEFIDLLNEGPVVIVGPARHAGLSKYLDMRRHVVAAEKNCYAKKTDVIARVADALSGFKRRATLCVSFSMGANVIVHELAKMGLGKKHHLLNVGSIWEPLVGHANRVYHRGLTIPIKPR